MFDKQVYLFEKGPVGVLPAFDRASGCPWVAPAAEDGADRRYVNRGKTAHGNPPAIWLLVEYCRHLRAFRAQEEVDNALRLAALGPAFDQVALGHLGPDHLTCGVDIAERLLPETDR